MTVCESWIKNKTMYFLTILTVSIGFTISQQGERGAPGPTGPCEVPEPESIPEIESVQISGKYPRAEITSATRASASYRRNIIRIRRSTCDCVRSRPLIRPPTTTGVRGPGGDPNSPDDTDLVPRQTDTCPADLRWFEFPVSQMWVGEKCWILRHWHNKRCQYRACRQRSCTGVVNNVTPPTGVHACQPNNWKTRYYYIWCPEEGLVLRSIRLPECCSCTYYRCRHVPKFS